MVVVRSCVCRCVCVRYHGPHASRCMQATLQGSDTGIRKLVYGARSDVIVGAGFQFNGLVWDASSNRLLMKLVGHRATIVDVAILKTSCVACASPRAPFFTPSAGDCWIVRVSL